MNFEWSYNGPKTGGTSIHWFKGQFQYFDTLSDITIDYITSLYNIEWMCNTYIHRHTYVGRLFKVSLPAVESGTAQHGYGSWKTETLFWSASHSRWLMSISLPALSLFILDISQEKVTGGSHYLQATWSHTHRVKGFPLLPHTPAPFDQRRSTSARPRLDLMVLPRSLKQLRGKQGSGLGVSYALWCNTALRKIMKHVASKTNM